MRLFDRVEPDPREQRQIRSGRLPDVADVVRRRAHEQRIPDVHTDPACLPPAPTRPIGSAADGRRADRVSSWPRAQRRVTCATPRRLPLPASDRPVSSALPDRHPESAPVRAPNPSLLPGFARPLSRQPTQRRGCSGGAATWQPGVRGRPGRPAAAHAAASAWPAPGSVCGTARTDCGGMP